MSEFIIIEEKIERRTYLKGRFTGKFIGYLDFGNSDLKHENFYDLEITDGKVYSEKANFRTWKEGDEFEEFSSVEIFLTQLPRLLPCEITYEDGTVKHFNLQINEPKLKNYKLSNRLYEQDALFASIEGEISGYLRHYDTEEREVEIIPPKPDLIEEVKSPNSSTTYGKIENHQQAAIWNQKTKVDQNKPSIGCAGCASLIGGLLIAYLLMWVIALIAITAAKVFAGIGIILLSVTSILLPVFFTGILLYIFVKLQPKLHPFWKWIFRLIIVVLLFLFWLN